MSNILHAKYMLNIIVHAQCKTSPEERIEFIAVEGQYNTQHSFRHSAK